MKNKAIKIKTNITTGLTLFLLTLSSTMLSPAHADTSIRVDVNKACEVLVKSRAPIINIIFDLGTSEERTVEFIFEELPDGSVISSEIGTKYVLGTYDAFINIENDFAHVGTETNIVSGVGAQIAIDVPKRLDCEKPAPEPTVYAVGDIGPAGGIVFSVNVDGTSGLETSPEDQVDISAPWCTNFTDIIGIENVATADGEDVNSGSHNTPLMLETCGANTVGAIVSDYRGPDGLTTGWFLPNIQELNLLYSQKSVVGSFDRGFYWSSSEFIYDRAWVQNFATGTIRLGNKIIFGKTIDMRIRAIRAF